MDISHFFVPLDEKERSRLEEAAYRLVENEDFVLLLRDWFEKAPPLSPSFLDREGNNATTAAKREGEKNVTRYVLKLIVDKNKPRKKRAKKQPTDPILDHMMNA